MSLWVQLLGAFLLLAAYGAAQLKYLNANGKMYLLLNALGSGLLAIDALVLQEWGFVILELSWMGISLVGFLKNLLGKSNQ